MKKLNTSKIYDNTINKLLQIKKKIDRLLEDTGLIDFDTLSESEQKTVINNFNTLSNDLENEQCYLSNSELSLFKGVALSSIMSAKKKKLGNYEILTLEQHQKLTDSEKMTKQVKNMTDDQKTKLLEILKSQGLI